MVHFRFSVAAGLLAALLLPAPMASAAAPAGSGIRADLLYHNYCSVCHGDKGDGRSRARAGLRPNARCTRAPARRNSASVPMVMRPRNLMQASRSVPNPLAANPVGDRLAASRSAANLFAVSLAAKP